MERPKARLSFLLTSLLAAALGCGSSSEKESPVDVPPITTPPVIVEVPDPTFYCNDVLGEVLDASSFGMWSDYPERQNIEAETLAIESSLSFTAPEEIYQQTINDLAQIRNDFSGDTLTGETAAPCAVLSEMLVGFDSEAIERFRTGNYTEWQTLNEQFGLVSASEIGSSGAVLVSFQRRYLVSTLIDQYNLAVLDGVSYIESNHLIGIDSDICREDKPDLSRVYIFYEGRGDCPAGCTEKFYSGYKIDETNVITHLGSFQLGSDSPEWFVESEQCRAFL